MREVTRCKPREWHQRQERPALVLLKLQRVCSQSTPRPREPPPGVPRPRSRGSWRWMRQTRFAPPPSTPDTRSEPAERRRQSCGRRRPSPRPRRRPVDKHAWTAIERRRRRRAAHPEPAGAAWAGAGAGGRAGTPPAEATMPLAALQAARGAPLAGLPHAPEGREGREAGSVTRGHGRCGPRRARARGSP